MNAVSPNTTVLLIGASRGLGYAIAQEYVTHGSRVVATVRGLGATSLDDLKNTAGELLEIEHVTMSGRCSG